MSIEEKKVEAVEVETAPLEHEEKTANEDISETPQIVIPTLEEHKQAFVKKYNGSRLISYLTSAIVIAIVVLSYLVIFPLEPNGTMAGIILIILTLVASTVFSRWHRQRTTKFIREYMASYNGEVNKFILEDSNVTNYVFDFGAKIETEEFTAMGFLTNIVNSNSRNVIRYEVGSFKVEFADFVAYRPDGNSAKSVFYGKFLSATREEKVDGRILIYLKPDPLIFKDTAGPDDLGDLELISDEPRYKLYATTKVLAKKVPAKALTELLKIEPDNELADVTVILKDNKLAVTLTYSDAIMIVPYKEVINHNVINHYKHNVTALNKFLSLLK